MKSQVGGLSSLPPSSDAQPLLDGLRLLKDTITNNIAEMAFSFGNTPTGPSLMLMYGVSCACAC